MGDKNVTQCANPNCTCHTQNAAKFCSDACANPADAQAQGCGCGHAGCASADYVRYRIGNSRYESQRADRLAARSPDNRQRADERRAESSNKPFDTHSQSNR